LYSISSKNTNSFTIIKLSIDKSTFSFRDTQIFRVKLAPFISFLYFCIRKETIIERWQKIAEDNQIHQLAVDKLKNLKSKKMDDNFIWLQSLSFSHRKLWRQHWENILFNDLDFEIKRRRIKEE